MKVITLLLGSVAVAAIIAVAVARTPTAQTPVAVKAAEDRFDAAWSDTMQVVGATVLRKADRERQAVTDPKSVPTERITEPPSPAAVPPVVFVEDEDKPRRKSKPHKVERRASRGDVCSRHGQRKVMVGKYRWRCRK